MGGCASNTTEEDKKNTGSNEKGSTAKENTDPNKSQSKKRHENKELTMKEVVETFKPFLFNRQNNKFLEKYNIVQRIIEETEGFRPEFLILRESTSPEGFDENLERLLEEFNEILTIGNITKEEFAEVTKFMIAENHILQKRLVNYQMWNVAELIINTYREYVLSHNRRFNKTDETLNLEVIFKENKHIYPYKQSGPMYIPKEIPSDIPFDFVDINRNLNLNIKFNEMRVVNLILDRDFYQNEEFMNTTTEFIKNSQNLLTVSLIVYFNLEDVQNSTKDPFALFLPLFEIIATSPSIITFMFVNANKIKYKFSDEFIDKLSLIISKPSLLAIHISGVNMDMKFVKALELSLVVLIGFNACDEDNDVFVDGVVKNLSNNKKLKGLYLAGFNLSKEQLEVVKRTLIVNPEFKIFEYLSNSEI